MQSLLIPAQAQVAGSVLTVGPYTVVAQPGAHLSPVLHLIRAAKHSLRLEVYLLTSSSIVHELSRAHSRGVDVRVLLEQHPFGGGRYARLGYSKLHAAGVPVRWANESAYTYTHEKSMEIDGTTAGIFTFNLSTSGMLSNREFGLIEQNSADAQAIADIFDADWNRRSAHVSSSHLVVSPTNSRRTFSGLIDNARKTLDVYAEEVDDASIESHLAAAVRRGVRVRLIVPATSSGVEAVHGAGVAVQIQPTPYVHAKAFVADGSRVFIGSENISATSLDRNREMGIVLSNRTLAQFVDSTFAADWKSGSHSVGGVSTGKPAPTAHASGSAILVAVSPHALSRGGRLTITGTAGSGAVCTVRVVYPNHFASRARSLRTVKTAGRSGLVSWSFTVGTSSKGVGSATVRCTVHGQTRSGSAPYEVE